MQSLKSSKPGSLLSNLHGKNGSHQKSTVQSASSSSQLGSATKPSVQGLTHTSNSAGTIAKEKAQKQIETIRTPLIHLLAMRTLSAKYLAQKLNCPQDIVEQALEKVGRPARIDPQKKELNDKTYKDLDVWAFNYPDPSDRDNAIQRSIAAFDRMRMSQEDPKWQMLYPKEERNKGNTLSRLNHLAKGAIQQSTTPRIHVQQPEETVDEKTMKDLSGESDQKGHLTPKGSEPMARSKSSDQIKKKKVSEKEAQTKRLLSNGPKKITAEAKEKEAHPAVKRGGSKKGPAPKSEEFVRDSDEEDGLEESMAVDALTSPPSKTVKPATSSQATTSSPALKGVSSKASKKTVSAKPATPRPIKHESNVKVSKPAKPAQVVQASFPNLKTTAASDVKAKEEEAKKRADGKAHPKKIPSSPAATPGAMARLSEAANQQGSTAMQKSLSRNRQGSSPHKPSPLGSSPPTNASEFGTYSQNNITPPSSASSNGKKSTSHPSHEHKRNISTDSALKPNGHHHNDSYPPSSSDTRLKRKANDLDSDIHNHSARSPLSNGHSPYTNSGRVMHNPTKKRKASSEEETDSSTSPLSEHELKLLEAQRFKTLHAKYEKAYREVMDSPNASPEQVQLVSKMHVRLDEMKRSIAKGAY